MCHLVWVPILPSHWDVATAAGQTEHGDAKLQLPYIYCWVLGLREAQIHHSVGRKISQRYGSWGFLTLGHPVTAGNPGVPRTVMRSLGPGALKLLDIQVPLGQRELGMKVVQELRMSPKLGREQ